MVSPSTHASVLRGSIIISFLVQLKNTYLCKGEQHQLVYYIMVVKTVIWGYSVALVELALILKGKIIRFIIVLILWVANTILPQQQERSWALVGGDKTPGCCMPWSKIWGEIRDWKGSFGLPVVLQAERQFHRLWVRFWMSLSSPWFSHTQAALGVWILLVHGGARKARVRTAAVGWVHHLLVAEQQLKSVV